MFIFTTASLNHKYNRTFNVGNDELENEIYAALLRQREMGEANFKREVDDAVLISQSPYFDSFPAETFFTLLVRQAVAYNTNLPIVRNPSANPSHNNAACVSRAA